MASDISLEGCRIILVEDDDDTREVFDLGLRTYGATVFATATAQVALLELQRSPPDILVLDISMPEVGGNELLQAVRALRPKRGWDTPAIAVTAYNEPEQRMKTLDAGFRHHLPKPINIAYLAAVIRDVARQPR